MSLYVQYHNYEKQGLWLNNAPNEFNLHTKQSQIQDAIGGQVCLIFDIGSPRCSYLWDSFTIENVEELLASDGQATYHATGTGWYLAPPQRLEGPEFEAFRESCANSADLRKVDEFPFADTLQRLAQQHRTPKSVAALQSFVQELKQLLPADADRKRLADHFNKLIKSVAKPASSKRR